MSEEVALPDIDPADAMLFAEHANVLQLEEFAKIAVRMSDDDRAFDEVMITLGYIEDATAIHIATCDVCIKGVRRFFNLYPTKEQIQVARRL